MKDIPQRTSIAQGILRRGNRERIVLIPVASCLSPPKRPVSRVLNRVSPTVSPDNILMRNVHLVFDNFAAIRQLLDLMFDGVAEEGPDLRPHYPI